MTSAQMGPRATRHLHRRQRFTPEEDAQLRDAVARFGDHAWGEVAAALPGRNLRQCRERWQQYLQPQRAGHAWTPEEQARLREKQAELGNRWKQISGSFPDRTENDVKNQWYSYLCPAATARPKTPRRGKCDPAMQESWQSENFDNDDLNDEY